MLLELTAASTNTAQVYHMCALGSFQRERDAIAGIFPFISNIPTKAYPLMQRLPILAVNSWTALEKPNCSTSGKTTRSQMDFEAQNCLYVVGQWDAVSLG